MSYEIHVGKIPKGKYVLHHCDKPLCVNPTHLFIGNQLDNVADMMGKGRNIKGEKCPWSKVTEDDVRAIRISGEDQDTLATRYGLCQQSISLIVRRINWKHVP